MTITGGDDVVVLLYGGILNDQGRGFYVGLELMALLRGTLDHADAILPDPTGAPIVAVRRSHDFARRLMGESRELGEGEASRIKGEQALEILAALGRGLRVPVPGRRRRKPWYAEHFEPAVGELIHYDAVFRRARQRDDDASTITLGGERKRVSVERYFYRGAGGLAHAMLRTDPNPQRLAAVREGFRRLVGDSNTPLGQLFAALGKMDKVQPGEASLADDPEQRCVERLRQDARWTELLRAGVSRILDRGLPPAKSCGALLHWVGYAIARYQLEVSCRELDKEVPPIPVDLGGTRGPIRRASRECHDRCRSAIVSALESKAEATKPELLEKGRTRSWRYSARGFFSGTLSALGALNATTGKRHFVLNNELLEAIVFARVDHEITFEAFCREVLFDELGLVVDSHATKRCGELRLLNRSDFDENAEMLSRRLATLGMLVRYSDHTRMVNPEVMT
jgi:hypothetical protein